MPAVKHPAVALVKLYIAIIELPATFMQVIGSYRGSVSDLAAPDQDGENLAYVRVADDIAGRIASGELASGTRLRSERQLAEIYQVAYGTVRRATAVLRERGLIKTIHGRGTFVA
jgi:GntR family transcriptional regulator